MPRASTAKWKTGFRFVTGCSQWGIASTGVVAPASIAIGGLTKKPINCACLVEIDCRPATVSRRIPNAYTGPRVTKAVCAIDVGLPVNPLGLEAQMMGGIMDGIGQVLTYALHLDKGAFLEASWDNAFYTRQCNVPPKVEVIVMPPTSDKPGGAGEFGVAASMAATATAYSRAVQKMQTTFPVDFDNLGFKPYPFVPPVPASPKNGLKYKNTPKQH